MYQQTRIQTHHRQTHHRKNLIRQMTEIVENLKSRTNMIWLMIENTENPKSRHVIKRKIAGNTINRTCHIHRRAIMILPTTVTTDASDVKEEPLGKGSYKIIRTVNGKVADCSI